MGVEGEHAPVAALAEEHADLDQLLGTLTEADWQRPTRCPGWTVADVVLHLSQTDEMAIASLEGRIAGFMARASGATSVDDGAAILVERERGSSPEQLLARWRAASGRVDEMLAEQDPHRRVTCVEGELSVRTLATTRLAEAWIHGGDVAEAVGAVRKPDGSRLQHVARLAWRTLPYAFAREGKQLSGPVGFDLTGPEGEAWSFEPQESAATVVRGDGVELCLVAARRLEPSATGLEASGPDAEAVLALVRTYA